MKQSNHPARLGKARRKNYRTYLHATVSEKTRTLYDTDLRHFKKWGGRLPATPSMVASYLARYAGDLSVATLARRLIAIGRAHIERNLPSPVRHPRVKVTFRGIKRAFGTAQKQALPLLDYQLRMVSRSIDKSAVGLRDNALLMIGFAGAFRRAELVALTVENLAFTNDGLVLNIPRSKTDQEQRGRKLAIPRARRNFCPVRSLERWLEYAEISSGPLFRRIDRHGNVGKRALHPSSVGLILRKRLIAAEIDPTGYSAHSLRAGLATSAAKAGVPAWKIRQQTGHRSDVSLSRYIRDQQIFENNASSAVFLPR